MTPNEKRRAGFPLAALRSMTTDDNRLRVVAAYERDAECRALLSLARWAKRHEKYAEEKFAASVTPIDRAFFRHYADNNHEVAAECRRRAKKGKR